MYQHYDRLRTARYSARNLVKRTATRGFQEHKICLSHQSDWNDQRCKGLVEWLLYDPLGVLVQLIVMTDLSPLEFTVSADNPIS